MNNIIRRVITPEIKVLDAKDGLVEYVASDESVDSFKEVIRADGWRFTNFNKNAPFVDSHDYGSIDKLLGKVVDFGVRGRKLIEVVQWAKDVAENKLAQIGWRMTEAGFLKAVSVGFWPVSYVLPGTAEHAAQLKQLNIEPMTEVRTIFTEQEQIELSAVIIGANPNALAKSYKAGVLTDADLETISQETAQRTVSPAIDPVVAELTKQRASEVALRRIHAAIARQ
jgi:hypothetical protein